jgi:hypothetical protein
MPLYEFEAQGFRYFLGQHGFAGARLAFDKQGALQSDGCIDGQLQILRGNVVFGPLEFHNWLQKWIKSY